MYLKKLPLMDSWFSYQFNMYYESEKQLITVREKERIDNLLNSLYVLNSLLTAFLQNIIGDVVILSQKKDLLSVSNIVNPILVREIINKRCSFECNCQDCNLVFTQLNQVQAIDKQNLKSLKELSKRLDCCNNCKYFQYVLNGSILYLRRNLSGFYDISNDNIYVKSKYLRSVYGLSILIHEYFHYLSKGVVTSGVVKDETNRFQIALNEGITELLACSFTQMCLSKLIRINRFANIFGDCNIIKSTYNMKYILENKTLNDLILIDNMPNIVTYRTNVKFVYCLMELLGVDEVISCYFNNDLKKLENEIIQIIGTQKYLKIKEIMSKRNFSMLRMNYVDIQSMF